MPTINEMVAQYSPQASQAQAPSIDDMVAKYSPQRPSPSPFGSNRGVAPPNSNSADDFNKSMVAGAEQAPFWLSDTANALTQGITRTAGAAYTGMGGDLSPEQAEKITNPTLPFSGSQDIYKDVGAPLYQPKTSLGILGQFLGNTSGIGAIGEAAPLADAAGSKIAEAVKGSPLPITRDMVKAASQNAYEHVADSGTTLTPALTDKALDVLQSSQQKPLWGNVLTSEQKDINNALSEYEDARGHPTTMSDLQGFDSTLGDKAAQAYVAGNANKGRIISGVQDKIRKMVQPENLQPGDITGSPEGITALTEHAIPLWATQAKMADLEKIVERASMMDNPSTGIKTGLRNYALNEGRMAQLPPEIQELVRKGATTGIADDLLGIMGSRLNPIVSGAVGGPHGAVVSNALSMLARGVKNTRGFNNAQAISDALVDNVRPSIEKYENYKTLPVSPQSPAPNNLLPPTAPLKALPAPQEFPAAMGAAAEDFNARKQKAATGSIGDQNMQQLQQLKQAMPEQPKPQSSLPDVKNFAKAESNGNPNAKNPNSTASGLYQFTNKTWADMVSRYGKQTGINLGDKNDPQAQATMARLYAQDNIASLQKTLGRMPTKPELYMAHVLGANGAARLINADPTKEAIMLYPRQVFDANRQIFFNGKTPRTVGEVQKILTSKVT